MRPSETQRPPAQEMGYGPDSTEQATSPPACPGTAARRPLWGEPGPLSVTLGLGGPPAANACGLEGESELKKEGPDAEMERGRKIMQESLCFLHSGVKVLRDFSSS